MKVCLRLMSVRFSETTIPRRAVHAVILDNYRRTDPYAWVLPFEEHHNRRIWNEALGMNKTTGAQTLFHAFVFNDGVRADTSTTGHRL